VFFDLVASGRLHARRAVISDENADLIGCYLRVRDSVAAVIAELERLADGHARGGSDHFLEVRDARFNPGRERWRAAGGAVERYSPELAAMLIYLNRTGYNGLFRVNQAGGFNVPPGRYLRPRIANRDGLMHAARALGAPGVEIELAPFDRALARARHGDFVYLDPPYAPLSRTASFRSYTANGFSDADQSRLQKTALALAGRGVAVVLSNSSAPLVVELFEQNRAAHAAGFRTFRIPARRAINTRGDRRAPVDELLVTTVQSSKFKGTSSKDTD
jgi:DNA adenine methylase